MNADCTGEFVHVPGFWNQLVEKLVVLDNGREIRSVVVGEWDHPLQRAAVRLSRTSGVTPLCGPGTARGNYVMRCDGVERMTTNPSYSLVSQLLRLEIAADGTMTGRHFGLSYPPFPVYPPEGAETSGVLTVNPDCTVNISQIVRINGGGGQLPTVQPQGSGTG